MDSQTYPIVIEQFPLLILIPASMVFFFLFALNRNILPKDSRYVKWILKRARLLWTIVLVGLFATVAVSAMVALATYIDFLGYLFFESRKYFHIALVMTIGFIVGLILAGSYRIRGVSGFLFATSLMLLIPLLFLQYNIAETAIHIVIDDFLENIFIFFILFGTSCQGWFFKKLTGERDVQSDAIRFITLKVTMNFAKEMFRKLKKRIVEDTDTIAEDAVSQVLQSEGRVGTFLTSVAVEMGLITSDEVEPDRIISLDIPEVSHPQIRQPSRTPRPSGTWLLTNTEFRKRTRINRVLSVLFLVFLVAVTVISSWNLSLVVNQWTFILLAGLIVVSIPLAFFDPLFAGRRLNVEELTEHVLSAYDGLEDLLSDEANSTAEHDSKLQIQDIEYESAGRNDQTSKVMLSSEHDYRASSSIQAFLRRIKMRCMKKVVKLTMLLERVLSCQSPQGSSIL